MADDQERGRARWARGRQLKQIFSGGQRDEHAAEQKISTGQISINSLADLATACWRAKKRAGKAAEQHEELRRIVRDLDSAFDVLRAVGFDVKDYTGEAFDYGLPLKVITTQPVNGLQKERVIETIKPTIFWKEHIVQVGEVIIETPTDNN